LLLLLLLFLPSSPLPPFPSKPPGFPTIRAEWQKLENPDLRKALKMKVRGTHTNL